MRLLVVCLLLVVGCVLDMEKAVVVKKSKYSWGCAYKTGLSTGAAGFIAPCDWFEVGDSLSKHMRSCPKCPQTP